MKIKKIVVILLVLILSVGMITGCGSGAKKGEPLGEEGLMICAGPDPETIDPALNSTVDGAIILTNAFSGLYGFKQNGDKIEVVADCAQEVVQPTALEDGKYQYVVTLKEGLKWSDGSELKASDFVYAWNRAVNPATAADYQYMFDTIDGYDAANPKLNIAADDAARTVTIVTKSFTAYFNELLAFPTYFPVKQEVVAANPDKWATTPETYVSNGAFKMTKWEVGNKIRFEKNENYWDAANVKLDVLTYALSEDDNANLANFENGTYKWVKNVPVQQIPEFQATRLDKDFFIGDYIGTYYLEFNVNKSFKPGLAAVSDSADAWKDWTPQQNAQVRLALSLLIDRNYIVEEAAQGGQAPATGFVPAGMDDGTGTEFRSKAEDWWSVKPEDLEKNREQAIGILKDLGFTYDEDAKKFTNFPTFEYSVNPTTGNLAIAEAIQNVWKDYGIVSTIDQRTWTVITTALTNGDFTMARLGWIADYNDPINFLEIYLPVSGNNHPQIGKPGIASAAAAYGVNKDQTWADAYETLINQIKSEADLAKRAEYMYQAETLLKETYITLPIYFYTNPYLQSESLINVINSPLGWVSFKYAEWVQ